MNAPRSSLALRIASAAALACCACAHDAAPAPQAAPPTARLQGEHQEVVDRLADEADDYCRVMGQKAKVLQVGTTDLSRDPESRHVVYECVEPNAETDEADASEPQGQDRRDISSDE